MKEENFYIHPSQLCIGLYVHLDLSWMNHPFTFSNFKIKDKEQIRQIRRLNLTQIRYDPNRSDYEPLPLKTVAEPEAETAQAAPVTKPAPVQPPPEASAPRMPRTPQERSARLKQLNNIIQGCEKRFVEDSKTARDVLLNLSAQPHSARKSAESLIESLAESALTEGDVVLHAISGNHSKPEDHVHSLNVAVLCLTLAKSMDILESQARELGMAALFHDVSKGEVPRHKSFIDQHCENSARMAKDAGLSDTIARVIVQHHEHVDGTGYPKHLVGTQMDPLARILAVVNAYDNLCNPFNAVNAMTPYEALAHMYATDHNKYDPRVLKLLIKTLGVYPPGSVVQLSNGTYGIVMSVNPQKPLLPLVRIHHPSVSRLTPVVIDLSEEEGLTIKKCLRPSQLPREIFEYLRPCKHVSYYFLDKSAPPSTQETLSMRPVEAANDITVQARLA